MSVERNISKTSVRGERFVLLDLVRAFAIISVVVYHLLQQMFGVGFLILPDGVAANLQRLEIFKGGGIGAWVQNILVAPFAYGFGAVSVFLILSGFGLTWSLLQKNSAAVKWGDFYLRKFRRLLVPFYISVLITFLLLAFRNWAFPTQSWWPAFGWLEYLKLMVPPFLVFDVHLLQQLEGAYWYITIILQFYLIYPLLYLLLKKIGTGKFLITMLVLTLAYRAAATYGFGLWGISFLDTAPMGVIAPAQNSYYGFCFFLPRLFEFAMGMALASWQNKNGRTLEWLTGGFALLAGLLIAAGGYALDYFRFGWIFSDLVIGAGLFIFFLNLAKIISRWKIPERLFKHIGDVSYEIYLLHHQLLQFLIFPLVMAFGLQSEGGFWIVLPVFLIGSWMIGEIGNNLSKMKRNITIALLIFVLAGCTPPGVGNIIINSPATRIEKTITLPSESTPTKDTPTVAAAKAVWPIADAEQRITKKPFGLKVSPQNSPVQPEKFSGYHSGVDFETFPDEQEKDVAISAICDGKILVRKRASGYGGVLVQACQLDAQEVTVIYGHLRLTSVIKKVGDELKAGESFAVLGTGYSAETDGERKHLHLGIHKGTAVSLLGYVQSLSALGDWIDFQQYMNGLKK